MIALSNHGPLEINQKRIRNQLEIIRNQLAAATGGRIDMYFNFNDLNMF